MEVELPTDADPVRVIEGDCIDVLRGMPDGCVDAVVTDPPYPGIAREYGTWTEGQWSALMDQVVTECRRVLKPSGSAVFVLQPNSERVGRMRTWLWEFMAKWGRLWNMPQDFWWWNPATMPNIQSNQARMFRPSVKACVWLGPPDCYRNQDAVLWRQSDAMRAVSYENRALKNYPSGHHLRPARIREAVEARGGVTPLNLLPVTNTDSTDSAASHGHGAGTPLPLARFWVRYLCPPDGLVVDCFGGSGTTALAALRERRRCLLIEAMPAYAAVARRRVAEFTGQSVPDGAGGVVRPTRPSLFAALTEEPPC